MEFIKESPKPNGMIARGRRYTEFFKAYDTPYMKKSNKIYAYIFANDFISLQEYQDGKYKMVTDASGKTKEDREFVRVSDTMLNNCSDINYTVYFNNSKDNCSMKVPWVLIGKEKEVAKILSNWSYRDKNENSLTVLKVDYKVTY